MFKIKCGDKYFKKRYLYEDELDALVDKYTDSTGHCHLGKLKNDNRMYEAGSCGYRCSIELTPLFGEASEFIVGDIRGLESKKWYRDLENQFNIEFIDVD